MRRMLKRSAPRAMRRQNCGDSKSRSIAQLPQGVTQVLGQGFQGKSSRSINSFQPQMDCQSIQLLNHKLSALPALETVRNRTLDESPLVVAPFRFSRLPFIETTKLSHHAQRNTWSRRESRR